MSDTQRFFQAAACHAYTFRASPSHSSYTRIHRYGFTSALGLIVLTLYPKTQTKALLPSVSNVPTQVLQVARRVTMYVRLSRDNKVHVYLPMVNEVCTCLPIVNKVCACLLRVNGVHMCRLNTLMFLPRNSQVGSGCVCLLTQY